MLKDGKLRVLSATDPDPYPDAIDCGAYEPPADEDECFEGVDVDFKRQKAARKRK